MLIAAIASAPAASTAWATARMSPAEAVSLAMSGRSVARRTADTAEAAESGSSANAVPPREALPHERLSSIPATPGRPSSWRAADARSDADSPARLTITGVGHFAQVGA